MVPFILWMQYILNYVINRLIRGREIQSESVCLSTSNDFVTKPITSPDTINFHTHNTQSHFKHTTHIGYHTNTTMHHIQFTPNKTVPFFETEYHKMSKVFTVYTTTSQGRDQQHFLRAALMTLTRITNLGPTLYHLMTAGPLHLGSIRPLLATRFLSLTHQVSCVYV